MLGRGWGELGYRLVRMSEEEGRGVDGIVEYSLLFPYVNANPRIPSYRAL